MSVKVIIATDILHAPIGYSGGETLHILYVSLIYLPMQNDKGLCL